MSKTIKLISLTLKNFKGIKDFTLDAQAENVKVFGDNATGKTTLFDGFVWLLFDKDSQNKKDFAIKTLNAAGKEEHGLEHAVEGTFNVDGNQLVLKKVYTEKWTKKRGSASAEFTGHTTDYFIDGVPKKKKEFTDKVAELVDEDVFKLLTSPSYFNEQLHWQKRRETLLEICGDITDSQVIASDKKLAKLPDILGNRTIEDHRKIIASRRSAINKELDKIPVRIDEIQHNLPDLSGLDKQQLEASIEQLTNEIDEKQDLISNIRNGNSILDKQKQIQEVEMELLKLKQEHESGTKDDIYRLKSRVQEEESNVSILNSKLESIKNSKRYNDDSIQRIENDLVKLREEWHLVDSEKLNHTDECECPACGQALPEEQVNAAKEKALAQFNKSKSTRLEDINAKGKQGATRKQELLQSNEQLANEYEALKEQITAKQEDTKKLKEQLHSLESTVTDITDNVQYLAKLNEKQNLTQELNDIKTSANQSIQNIQMEIASIKSERNTQQSELSKFTLLDQSEARIKELEEQERALAAEYEKLEEELYLTEEFIRRKVSLLEDKINSKFRFARFKLFGEQINGGLVEACETLYKGVPYSSGLNNAARINVGLDIINTLSEHYGVYAPIFVDNSEAVTKLIDVNAQVISLVVSEQDKQLRVESKSDTESEVA